jgi:hypothetical protein
MTGPPGRRGTGSAIVTIQREGAQASLDDYAARLATSARETGQERALNVVTEDDWTTRAQDVLETFRILGIEFDAADLRAEVGRAPSPGAAGAVIRQAAAAGLIRCTGFTRSRDPSRRGGFQLTWRGVP